MISNTGRLLHAVGVFGGAITMAYILVRRVLALKRVSKKRTITKWPPSPSPQHPILGHAPLMPPTGGPANETKLLEWCNELGSTTISYTLPLVGRFIATGDPDLAHYVLVHRNIPKSYVYKLTGPLLGTRSMLTAAHKEPHQSRRRMFHKGFQPGYLNQFCFEVMKEKTVNLLEACSATQGTPCRMLDLTTNYTSQIISAVAYGEDWDDHRHPARVSLDYIAGFLTKALSGSEPWNMFNPFIWSGAWKHHSDYHREMNAIVRRKMKDPSGNDIVSMALRDLMAENAELDEETVATVIDNLKTIYIAGHETTANLLSHAVWLLAQHPDVLLKIRTELDSVLDNGNWYAASTLQYKNCVYLDAVLKEVLRLYPPSSFSRWLSHTSANEEAVEWNGYRLDGATILIAPFVMHRAERNWGPQAHLFQPQRFLDDPNPKAFIPFSKGVYDCLGRSFGMMEAQVALAALITGFDFEAVEPEKEFITCVMTLRNKYGCMMRLTPRNKATETA